MIPCISFPSCLLLLCWFLSWWISCFFAWLVKEFLSDYELLILFVFCFNECSTVFDLPLVYVNNRTTIYKSDLALSILSSLGLDSWVLMSPRIRNIATYNCFLLVFHFFLTTFSHERFYWNPMSTWLKSLHETVNQVQNLGKKYLVGMIQFFRLN